MPDAVIEFFVLHKGMLERIDPALLCEAAAGMPIFANDVFAIYGRHGQRLPAEQEYQLAAIQRFTDERARKPVETGTVGITVMTYNRSPALRRTLRSLARLRRPMLVIDDGSSPLHRWRNRLYSRLAGMRLPKNMGLACARNAGFAHWLTQPEIEWISAFDDDVEVASNLFDVLAHLARNRAPTTAIFTGYRSPVHREPAEATMAGRQVFFARSCSGRHMHAHRDYWTRVLPTPTAYPEAPKPIGGAFAGQGCDSDWWLSCWSPKSGIKSGIDVVVVPGLVTTFGAGHSSWGSSGL